MKSSSRIVSLKKQKKFPYLQPTKQIPEYILDFLIRKEFCSNKEQKLFLYINSLQVNDHYFLTSTDKIRPFLESKAKEILKSGDKSKKIFNKIGHALHALNPVFNEITFDTKVKEMFKSLDYKKPIVCQSMYIFKQPFIGGEGNETLFNNHYLIILLK